MPRRFLHISQILKICPRPDVKKGKIFLIVSTIPKTFSITYGMITYEGGYVEMVFEFTDVDRATGVAKIFFMLLTPGLYGVYRTNR
jgi:hypothetical protein